jgi:hypothetical protein
MNNITNYRELLVEKQRLTLLLEERKILLQTEFEEVKEKLKPLSHLVNVVGKLSSKDTGNPLLNVGVSIGVNLLLKNVLLRNAGWIVKLLMPAMVKNYLSHEPEQTTGFFNKIGGFLKKQFKQHL